ncbi:MAG: hypothetical protein WD054_02870 [Gemmatimonadota bacterium]
MHIVLTDLLTCPRCGPEYGLILLAERVEERRVLAGALGCSNCREKYRVSDGIAWLADPGDVGAGPGTARAQEDGAEGALRLGALMGSTTGPGFMLVAGPGAAHAGAIARLIESVEVVVVETLGAEAGLLPDTGPGTSRLVVGGGAARLPLAGGKLLGVALTGAAADGLLEEGARVVSPVGRLVLDPAPADAAVRLTAVRMRPLVEMDGVVVAGRDPRA